jgi:quercetin dioxygenase-like cupin family protein
VELWEWRLEPGEHYPSEPDADGYSEQIYVFEGCLTLMLGGQPQKIAAGEFYMFASNQPHSYRNEGDVAARFVRNVVI